MVQAGLDGWHLGRESVVVTAGHLDRGFAHYEDSSCTPRKSQLADIRFIRRGRWTSERPKVAEFCLKVHFKGLWSSDRFTSSVGTLKSPSGCAQYENWPPPRKASHFP